MYKKGVIGLLLAIVAVGMLALVATACARGAPKERVALKVAINFPIQLPHFVGYYYALDKGLYAAEGLDVELLHLGGSLPSVQSVGAGTTPIGSAAADAFLIGIEQGLPITAVWVQYQANPTGVIALPDRGIKTFKDLKGKRISTAVASPEGILLRARLREAGLDPDREVTIVNVAPAAKLTTMLAGEADASTGFVDYQLIQARNALKKEPVWIPFTTEKDRMYGFVILVNNDYLKKNPDVVRRFLKGSIEGYIWARDRVEEAADFTAKRAKQEGEKAFFTDVWRTLLPHMSSDLTKRRGVGYMEDSPWKNLADTLLQGAMIKKTPDIKKIYTNEYIPANARKW